MTRKSNRREFLRGRLAADVVADAIRDAAPGGAGVDVPGGDAVDAYLVHVSRRAMACEFEIRLNAGQYEDETQRALEALDLVDQLEEQLSFFRETSELSRINREAADGPVEVEPGLFELIETSVRLSTETDGAFDLTATPLWEAWGFSRRAGAMPDQQTLDAALQTVGSRFVELDPRARTIRFRKPGIRLNLGSVGKGYALDRCGERLQQAGITDWLFHGGNSSVMACGSLAGRRAEPPAPIPGWVVGIRHPLRPERRLAEVRLRNRGLATSGSHAQSFVHQGRRYGHILDPRTGWPGDEVLSATAVAPTAALADALATAFYVMGPEASLEYCRTRPQLGAVLACPIRHSGGVEIRAAGLADDELRLI